METLHVSHQNRASNSKHFRLSDQQPAWPGEQADLRPLAEEVLREMAFVYHLTRTIKQSILEKEDPRKALRIGS